MAEKKEEVKKDDSSWEIVNVPTQHAPMIHNKETDELLTEQQALVKILEELKFLRKVMG